MNKIIQENIQLKSQIEKYKLNNQKNEQKISFYEEQFNMFKSNNENYKKIINELKSQNEELLAKGTKGSLLDIQRNTNQF